MWELSAALICCVGVWMVIIAGPILISTWLGANQCRSSFKSICRSLKGTISKDNSDSIEVQFPGSDRQVLAAFFPRATHWFGRRVLEMHFVLDPTDCHLFICGNRRLSRNLPDGWRARSGDTRADRLVATATHELAERYLEAGLLQAYDQLATIHPLTSRLAVSNDRLVLLVADFSNSVNELSSLLIFGRQVAAQIERVQAGDIELVTIAGVEPEDANCPICCAQVVQPLACQRCGTLQCRECWAYNDGRCGVFGCGGQSQSASPRR